MSKRYYPETWSSWDVESFSSLLKVPDMAEVMIGFYDTKLKKVYSQILLDNIVTLADRSIDGQYYNMIVKIDDETFSFEHAAHEDMFCLRITPQNCNERYKLLVSGTLRWNAKGSVGYDGEYIEIKTDKFVYKIDVIGEIYYREAVNVYHSGFVLSLDSVLYIRCNNDMSKDDINKFINSKKESCLNELRKTGGFAADLSKAIQRVMLWNTIYEPTNDRFVTPVTRQWCNLKIMEHFGCYVLFCWDTFFGALLCGIFNKELAIRQIESILEEFRDGCIPLCGSQVRIRSERSQPPVGSYCVLKLYMQFNDTKILENSYDKLKAWNEWWFRNRDGNGDGLLEWGCNKSEIWPLDEKWLQSDAYCESGMDNSPVHDGIRYNSKTNTLEQNYIDLNSLFALDCLCLAQIAKLLSKNEDEKQFNKKYEEMKKIINDKMWNEEMGIYCNLKWDGTFNDTITPANFYPMIAGIASKEKADRMVNDWLLNPKKFYGEFMIPTVARDHPSYLDNDYWRGRIWGPTNFIVYEALKKYEYFDVAHILAVKSRDLFLKNWREKGYVFENYNAETGLANDVKNADPFYTWGGLLPYIYLSEIVEAQPFEGLRFGNLANEAAFVEMPLNEDIYRVSIDIGLTIKRNGNTFIESTSPVLITGLHFNNNTLYFKLQAKTNGYLIIYGQDDLFNSVKVESSLLISSSIKDNRIIIEYEANKIEI